MSPVVSYQQSIMTRAHFRAVSPDSPAEATGIAILWNRWDHSERSILKLIVAESWLVLFMMLLANNILWLIASAGQVLGQSQLRILAQRCSHGSDVHAWSKIFTASGLPSRRIIPLIVAIKAIKINVIVYNYQHILINFN